MRTLILYLSDFSYPYLDKMLVDIRMNGIDIVPVLPKQITRELEAVINSDNRNYSYIITDCEEGIELAVRQQIGFVFYENGTNMNVRAVSAECIIQGFEEIDTEFITKMYERYHHLPWTILTTDRLTLREITVHDVDRLYEIYENPSITEYMEPLYEDKQEEIAYTEDYIRNIYEFCGYGLWLVIENETGRIVGRAGITNREGYKEAELGYVIEVERQRRGYAREVCSAIIDYAREMLEMKALNCFVREGNLASIKLCEGLGFEAIEQVIIDNHMLIRYYLELNSCCDSNV